MNQKYYPESDSLVEDKEEEQLEQEEFSLVKKKAQKTRGERAKLIMRIVLLVVITIQIVVFLIPNFR